MTAMARSRSSPLTRLRARSVRLKVVLSIGRSVRTGTASQQAVLSVIALTSIYWASPNHARVLCADKYNSAVTHALPVPAANGISLLRRGKGRLQASRFSQTIHIVRAFLQAFLRQMQQVHFLFLPTLIFASREHVMRPRHAPTARAVKATQCCRSQTP